MKQKTEASQAVYFPPLPEPDHSLDNGTQPYFTAIQMFAYARAALKAQPAPTEAQGAQLSGNSGELAQGEDSARLDPYRLQSMSSLCGCKACNQIMTRRMMFICGKCGDKNCPSATNHLNKCTDRARASAETGGVKS